MVQFPGSIATETTAPVPDYEIFYFYTTQRVYIGMEEFVNAHHYTEFQMLQSSSDILAEICVVGAKKLYWSSSTIRAKRHLCVLNQENSSSWNTVQSKMPFTSQILHLLIIRQYQGRGDPGNVMVSTQNLVSSRVVANHRYIMNMCLMHTKHIQK